LSSSFQASALEKPDVQSSTYVYRPVDFARIAQYFALDVISDIAFGQPFGFLDTDADVHDYIKTQEALLPIFEWFSTLPSLERLTRIRWISRLLMPKPTDEKGLGRLMGVAEKIVNQRYSAADRLDPKSDMLGSFIRHGLPQEQAKIESVLQIMAGSDTTVATLRMTVLFVCTAPSTLHKLLAELDAAEKEGKLSRPMARDSEIRAHLPYLCASIRETLRMWPPVLGLGFKEVPEGGDTINGIFLPAGTSVGYGAWGLHRSKALYGEDANIYRPERWIDTKDEEKLAAMNRSADLVFSYGKNGCLGKPVAFMELNKAITEVSNSLIGHPGLKSAANGVKLFRRFDFSLVNPLKPIRSLNRNGLFVQSDMWVRISQREGVDEF
jgi:cytochrome P450